MNNSEIAAAMPNNSEIAAAMPNNSEIAAAMLNNSEIAAAMLNNSEIAAAMLNNSEIAAAMPNNSEIAAAMVNDRSRSGMTEDESNDECDMEIIKPTRSELTNAVKLIEQPLLPSQNGSDHLSKLNVLEKLIDQSFSMRQTLLTDHPT